MTCLPENNEACVQDIQYPILPHIFLATLLIVPQFTLLLAL